MLASAPGVENILLPTFIAQLADPNDNQLPASDAWWALRSQRNMAIDEPISKVMNIGGHNAFNSLNEGYGVVRFLAPNQILSLGGQLDLGARLVELDVHDPLELDPSDLSLTRNLLLKHGPGPYFLTRSLPLYLDPALSEIRDWLTRANNQHEVIFLDIEDSTEQAEAGADDPLIAKLESYFGSLIYTPAERAADGEWPSRSELIARNDRVVIFTHRNDDQHGRFGVPEMHVDPNGHVWYGASIAFRANSGDDSVSNRGNFAQVRVDEVGVVPSENADFFFVVQSDGIVLPGDGLLDLTPPKHEPSDVADAVRRNVDFIKMDFLFGDDEDADLGNNIFPTNDPFFDIAQDNRVKTLEAAVWSWAKNDPAVDRQIFQDLFPGDGTGLALHLFVEAGVGTAVADNLASIGAAARSNGRDVAIQVDGRWVSHTPVSSTPMIFAARTVTANAAGEFTWAVTTAASTNWHDGHQVVADEFGSGFIFAGPVNGFQNAQLSVAAGPVWMNVHDLDADGNWQVGSRAPAITRLEVQPGVVAEGGTVQLTVDVLAGSHDHELQVDWGDGSPPTTHQLASGQGGSFVVPHTYQDDHPATDTSSDTFNILVRVTGAGGLSDDETIQVTVNNVDPALVDFASNATFESTAKEGMSVTILANFTDVGILDTHSAVVDWGDGSDPQVVTVNQGAGSGTVAGSHAYAAGGIYTISLALTDDDTGVDTITTTAVVTGVGLNNGILYVIGGSKDDLVSVIQTGKRQLTAVATFLPRLVRSFDITAVDKIVAYLGDGDDLMSVSPLVRIPAVIHGGKGDDYLISGGGPTALLGDEGDDHLIGLGWRNVLIGGLGKDKLTGGLFGDVHIGGSTNIDNDDNALLATAMAWNAPTPYAQRVLAVDALFEEVDDGEKDKVTGSAGLDLFYKGVGDSLTGVKSNEIVL